MQYPLQQSDILSRQYTVCFYQKMLQIMTLMGTKCVLGCFSVCIAHLYTCDQLLYTLFWRHIHHSCHVTLSSEVTWQAPQGLIGRLLADVSDHHGGAFRGEALTHRPSNPTASSCGKRAALSQWAGRHVSTKTLELVWWVYEGFIVSEERMCVLRVPLWTDLKGRSQSEFIYFHLISPEVQASMCK